MMEGIVRPKKKLPNKREPIAFITGLFLRAEFKFLDYLFIAPCFHEQFGPVIAIIGLQGSYAILRSIVIIAFVLYLKGPYFILYKKIPEDQFSLVTAVIIALTGQGNVYPIIKIACQLTGIAVSNGGSDFFQRIFRGEGEAYQRQPQQRNSP
jgi:hypothetical protein